jgi:antiviral helicase SKI2
MFRTMQYTVFHGEKVMRAIIAGLKLAISDQNLELIPDYEQRIEVLKELKFIDENSTVSLKGRVACEVSSFPLGDHREADDPRLIPPMS